MSKVKKIIICIAIIITVIIGLALGFGGNYLYNLALDPTTDKSIVFGSDEESTEAISQTETSGEVNIDAEAWLLNDSGYESLYRTSKDGLKLHNYLIKNNSNKWVITVHGYTSEGKLMSNYGKKFYDMGYNVLIPDLRGHGKSEGDYIGMGWDDRLDIISWINYILNEDPNAEFPRLTYGQNPNNYQKSDYWLRDGSYLRLKTLDIGYSLPTALVNKIHLNRVRVFFVGTNLLTFSDFKLWDPELGVSDGKKYPLSRTFSLGVSVNL